MIITRNDLLKIGYVIKEIRNNNLRCNINLKYKILKLENIIREEFEITNVLLQELSMKYEALKTSDQEDKLTVSEALKLEKELKDFSYGTIQIPEYYFFLEELEELQLDWNSMSAFMPFIKD